MMERILKWFGDVHNIKWMALRYFNAAGADIDGEIGEVHEKESHLIPLVLQSILGQRDHIDIYGTDYKTSDGTAVRDYIHVTDLAEAHLKALDYLVKGGKSDSLNLGTGKGYSVKKVIQIAERVTGKKVPSKEAPRRAGDPPALVADASKAQKVLKWIPQHSDLKTIIKTAWNWHTSQR